MSDLSALSRRKVRYWCFRFATEVSGGPQVDINAVPVGLKEHFEANPWFQGWKDFGVTWDVVAEKPLEMVPIFKSLELVWNEEVKSLARDLPVEIVNGNESNV